MYHILSLLNLKNVWKEESWELLLSGSLPGCAVAEAGLGLRPSAEDSAQLWGEGLRYLSIICCFLGSVLLGGWNQELELEIEPRFSNLGRRQFFKSLPPQFYHSKSDLVFVSELWLNISGLHCHRVLLGCSAALFGSLPSVVVALRKLCVNSDFWVFVCGEWGLCRFSAQRKPWLKLAILVHIFFPCISCLLMLIVVEKSDACRLFL